MAEQGIASEGYCVTSWSELARDGQRCEADGADEARNGDAGQPHITRLLQSSQGPIVAASDYVRLVPESIRAYLPAGRRYSTLGTDGFGRSDTRAELRRFFPVDAKAIAGIGRGHDRTSVHNAYTI